MYNFFDHYLGIDAGRIYNEKFDESFVPILPKEALMVFNEQNPLPANALKGDEAVIRYLRLN